MSPARLIVPLRAKAGFVLALALAIVHGSGGAEARSSIAESSVARLRALPPFAALGRDTRLVIEADGSRYRATRTSPWSSVGSFEVTLPRRADGAIRLEAHGGDGVWLELSTVDASSAEGVPIDGVLVHEVDAHTELVRAALADGVEHVRVLRTPAAPTRVRYKLRVGPPSVSVRLHDHRIQLVDGRGAVRIESDPAFVVDAAGRMRDVDVELARVGDDWEMIENFDPSGLSYPLTVDPAWRMTGSTENYHVVAHAARLPSGKVLLGGDYVSRIFGPGPSGELYDPTTGTWSLTGTMAEARRRGETLTLLPSGKVLVAGGLDFSPSAPPDPALHSAELYDPTTNSWSSAAPLAVARYAHVAALTSDGRVLVAGGRTSTAELYDPSTNKWSAAGTMKAIHDEAEAVTLPSGIVLVAGGTSSIADGIANVELYDPKSNSWSAAADMSSPRAYFTLTLLKSGKVLAIGGSDAPELYDPAANTWTRVSAPSTARGFHTATLLLDGRVLVAGGPTSSAEIYDSALDRWLLASPTKNDRKAHAATLLTDGSVLIAGGLVYGTPVGRTAEVFTFLTKGAACTYPGDCSTGFCTDGVCCDVACGDSSPSDCLVCSVAKGAAKDGTCTPIAGCGDAGSDADTGASDAVLDSDAGARGDAGDGTLAGTGCGCGGARSSMVVSVAPFGIFLAAIRRRRRLRA